MFQNLDMLKTAMSMARHAGYKQALTSQNIANADTPGFAARRVQDFSQLVPSNDIAANMTSTRPTHFGFANRYSARPVFTAAAEPNGNGVVLEDEILGSVDAKRQHDRALSIYQASLGMLRSVLSKQ